MARQRYELGTNQKRRRLIQAARFVNIAQVKRYRWKFSQIKKLTFTHVLRKLEMKIRTTNKTPTATFAHEFNSHSCRTYWQECGVNVIISPWVISIMCQG